MAIFTTFFAAENMEAKEAFDELKKMAPELAKAEVHEVREPKPIGQKNGVAMLSMIRLKTIWLANGD